MTSCIFCLWVQMSRTSIIVKLILGLLWGIIHLAISVFNIWSHLIYNLECYLISWGLLWKYWNLNLGRLKYLAIVVDSKEAKNTAKIKQLIRWLTTIGVKYVCIYDIDGKTTRLSFLGSSNFKDLAAFNLNIFGD
jgi:ditrans,polycis-polyprenyl diphosphate synthase